MKEAESSTIKKEINLHKLPLHIDENKLKQLEARIIGPSSDGNLPFEFQPLIEVDVEHIKSSINIK
jgi:seryl-tRNA(Sec) selenium transferase